MAKHTILGGKVHVYRRENSRNWQCATYLNGKNHRTSTKLEDLAPAKDFAEDWYLELRGKHRVGELSNDRTFGSAAQKFLSEQAVVLAGDRSPRWLVDHEYRLRLHLLPFFGKMGLSQITAGKVQEYRAHRIQSNGKPIGRSTLHNEIVTLRQVLKNAIRHGWLNHLPDFSAPYNTTGKVGHRAWFSKDEYRKLYEATRKNARDQKGKRDKWNAEQLHDKILFMANTGIRPDEANWLEYRDIEIVLDEATGETILEIQVRGKRGVGYCKSTHSAVRPFERMIERNQPEPTDRLFPTDHKKMFNRILNELGLCPSSGPLALWCLES